MAGAGDHPLVIGTRVALRGTTWRLEHRTPHLDCESLRLRVSDDAADGRSQTFLLPFDRCLPLDVVQRCQVVGRRRFFHAVAQHLLATHGFGETLAARASSIDLKAFQLEPLLAVLRHARLRIFIADSVGLGKTIQAGLIVSELAARDDAFRALIVVPAGLRAQWQDELRARFSLEAAVADSRWLTSITRDLPEDINPWSLPGVYVASHDFLKQPEVLRGLADVRWDLLVADEVHGAGPGTARLAALQTLGARSRRIVLLSATPPDSEPAALRALADIGRFDGEPPMTIFRRSRHDVGDSRTRRTVWLPVRLSAAERLMHARLDTYAARLWRESVARQDPSARLAAMVLKKRALSTASSLLASVRRRIALLGSSSRNTDGYIQLPLFEEDPLADDPDDDVLGAPGLADPHVELSLLTRIAGVAERAAAAESKIHALRRLLRRISEPAIVFTEYRDTVTQLAGALTAWHPAILTGAMAASERSAVQRGFAAEGSLLLATDAASEGLNLHHRCRVVIHFELPWVPMRLEQRAGRVDRLGQRKSVHEIMLVARHTSERYVLGPLVRRIRTAVNAGVQTTLASLSESAVASGVLAGGRFDTASHTATPFESLSLGDDAESECRRIASLRTIATKRPSAQLLPPRDLVIRRDVCRTNAATVLIRTRLERHGTLLDDRLIVLLVARAWSTRPGSAAALRRLAAQLVRELTPEQIAGSGALHAAMQVEACARHSLSTLLDREGALATAAGNRQRPVQAGLFDRREMQRADADDRTATLFMQDTRARIDSLTEVGLRREFEVVAIGCGGQSSR